MYNEKPYIIMYIKVKIDNVQQNRKCKLCRESDETSNHNISEFIKLAQNECKTWFN